MHPTKLIDGDQSQKILYVIASVIGILFLLLAFLGFGLFSYKWRHSNLNSFTTRRSTASCLSPDLVAGLSKYSLINYSFDELSNATKCFSEETKLGSSVNKGILGENPFAVKRMSFSDAQRTISVYSQINHTNIINLEGVCHGGKELSSSYLVFEFARNGNLRDCLNNHLDTLPWHKRSQIALDVAEGLHYIHHCTIPSYIHLNISSRNILITNEWGAKIANLGTSSAVSFAICDEWITPEYINGDPISPKVDVFAFGVVLLELLTAKEARDGSLLREKLSILSEKGRTNGCLQELNELMDQSLKEYAIGDVLCMALVAKACVEEEPSHRPTMHDILKILATMVR